MGEPALTTPVRRPGSSHNRQPGGNEPTPDPPESASTDPTAEPGATRESGTRPGTGPDAKPAADTRDTVPTDEILVTQAALGDRAAFADLVRRHGPSLYRYALRMLDGDHSSAEDAVQDGFVDAWVNLPQFRHQASVHTWLFRLTANRVLKERRRRRPVPVDDRLLASQPDPERRTPEATAEHAQLWQTLDLALGELPWRQRASWMLRELEVLSYDDIAQILDTTPTVVRGQLHRARRALAIRMEQWR